MAKTKVERVTISLNGGVYRRINNHRFDNRISSFSTAVEQLVLQGFQSLEHVDGQGTMDSLIEHDGQSQRRQQALGAD
jgi:hypothetical protein